MFQSQSAPNFQNKAWGNIIDMSGLHKLMMSTARCEQKMLWRDATVFFKINKFVKIVNTVAGLDLRSTKETREEYKHGLQREIYCDECLKIRLYTFIPKSLFE